MKVKIHNRSGVILISALWMLVILSFTLLALSRSARIQTALAKYFLIKTRLAYLTWAGVVSSLEKILEDSKDETSKDSDTLLACGVKLPEGKTLENLFKDIPMGEGSFSIVMRDSKKVAGKNTLTWGFIDEERKINLNALNADNLTILKELLIQKEVEPDVAEDIAQSVLDWIDQDESSPDPKKKENEYYTDDQRAYYYKNRPLDAIEELTLIKGMDVELFKKLKNDLTIYPRETADLKVNLNTASLEVLQALVKSATTMTNTSSSEAERLAQRIVDFRRGQDRLEQTADDRLLNESEMNLNESQRILFQAIAGKTTNISRFFRIGIQGKVNGQKLGSTIELVVSRDELKIADWKQF